MGLPKMLSWIDQTFSKIPSLSFIVVVVCVRKNRPQLTLKELIF